MKYSYQREVILNTVQKSKGHLTAQEVYEQVQKIIPNISLGTVYRNLNFLDEHHLLRRIIVPYASDEFDYNTHDHSHIYCTECMNIYDLDSTVDENIKQVVEEATGYEITNASVVFQGICHDCKEKKEG